jgi:UDP-N-acetylmuramoyl-tripeptide--D-alanyl-D-alanine ligase
LPAPRMLVLGDMGEVGEQGLAFHEEVLGQALAAGIETVHVAGEWMLQATQRLNPGESNNFRHWSDVDALADHVAQTLADNRSVLVKGSRFMRMERVVKAAQALATGAPNPTQKDPSNAA